VTSRPSKRLLPTDRRDTIEAVPPSLAATHRMARIGHYDDTIPALPDRSDHSPAAWSAPLGVWLGVAVRVHVSLAVALAASVIVCLYSGSAVAWLALATYVASLLLHESAHVAAAARATHRAELDPGSDPVVFGALGGMRLAWAPVDPRERVFVSMAGPMANLTVAVAALSSLAIRELPNAGTLLERILSNAYAVLLTGEALDASIVVALAHLLVAVNLLLFLVNLAPASPLDGGEALRAWLSVWVGPRVAREATLFAALLFGGGLLAAAWIVVLSEPASPVAAVVLATLAVVVAFGAWNDATIGRCRDVTFCDPTPLGVGCEDDRLLRRLLDEPHDAPFASASDEPGGDAWDDDRVDDILAKVHAGGMTRLTANERAILERASERYRRLRGA